MDDSRRGRLAPLIAVLVLLLATLAWQGPRWYRDWRFRQDCSAMLGYALAGKLDKVEGTILPEQRPVANVLFRTVVPANYSDELQSLKLSSFEHDNGDPAVIWALVTARFGVQGDPAGLAEGKLRWVWNGSEWEWDFEGSYGAMFPTAGEAQWVKLGDFITVQSGD